MGISNIRGGVGVWSHITGRGLRFLSLVYGRVGFKFDGMGVEGLSLKVRLSSLNLAGALFLCRFCGAGHGSGRGFGFRFWGWGSGLRVLKDSAPFICYPCTF